MEEALTCTNFVSATNDVDAADAPEQYPRLIASVVHRAIAALPEKERVGVGCPASTTLTGQDNCRRAVGADLVNVLIDHLDTQLPKLRASEDSVAANPKPRVLTSLLAATPTGEKVVAPQPKTALAQTALLTNAPGEPTLYTNSIGNP